MSLKKSLCSLKPHIGTNFYPILKILIILFIPDPFSLFSESQCLWVKKQKRGPNQSAPWFEAGYLSSR